MIKSTLPITRNIGIICHFQKGFTYQEHLPLSAVELPKSVDTSINLLAPNKRLPRIKRLADVMDLEGHGAINPVFFNRALQRLGGPPLEEYDLLKEPHRVRFTLTGGEFGACVRNTVVSMLNTWSRTVNTDTMYGFKWSWLPEIVIRLNKTWDISKANTSAPAVKASEIVHGGKYPAHLGHWVALLRNYYIHVDKLTMTVGPSVGEAHPRSTINGFWVNGKQVITTEEAKDMVLSATATSYATYAKWGKWAHRQIKKGAT